jgi:hypothetical protein
MCLAVLLIRFQRLAGEGPAHSISKANSARGIGYIICVENVPESSKKTLTVYSDDSLQTI